MKVILTEQEYNELKSLKTHNFHMEVLRMRISDMSKKEAEEKVWVEEHREVVDYITGKKSGRSFDEVIHCLYEEYLELKKWKSQYTAQSAKSI